MKRFLLFLPVLALARNASGADSAAERMTFFENRVRPVLAEHCYRCHSEAKGAAKGGLTLDTKAGWEKGGEHAAAIIPGKPGESLLIRAVKHLDEDLAMPPKGEKLDDGKIADLEAWIAAGAEDPRTGKETPAGGLTGSILTKAKDHRFFQPVKDQPAPKVRDTAWPVNEIDRFVLAKLEERGLKPSPEADRRTLIRRAFFDLTGLPPEPEEVEAFVNDTSPDAFEKVVDALLASPRYGERQARHWLDVARYADTRGQTRRRETTLDANAWTYRDYVIRSLNEDKPFDQFIREQIAADLLPGGKDGSTLAALGFLTQGDRFNGNRQDVLNDRIDVVTKGFLGLTVTCARCHDHFFDPVSQRDYYALHGIFNSTREPEEKPVVADAANPEGEEAYEAARARILEAGRVKVLAEIDSTLSVFNRNAAFFLEAAGMERKSQEFYQFVRSQKIDGRVANEIIGLTRRAGRPRGGEGPGAVLFLARAANRVVGEDFAAGFQPALARARRSPQRNAAVVAAFRGTVPESREEALKALATVFSRADAAWRAESAAWRESGQKGAFPGLKDPELEKARTALLDPAPFREGDLPSDPRGLPRDLADAVNRINAELARLNVSHPGAPGMANALEDDPRPKDSPVFLRGQVGTPGPIVSRGYLEYFSQPDNKPVRSGSGRLELAEAIASPSNPLTARVIVNRVWARHFGEGFVSTPDDVGLMSGEPSHPELLDHLAARFMADWWSLKKLDRAILLSRAWRQSSAAGDTDLAKADPFNRLLGRQNMRRLDFEALRDSVLYVGGKLDLTMGGHPVNMESEPYSRRRSVYGFIHRTEMAEFMRHFDVANPALPTGKRQETIVPQQALFRMNSLLVIEQARNLMAREDVATAASDEEVVTRLYGALYQRPPRPEETALALEFVSGAVEEGPGAEPRRPAKARQERRPVPPRERAAAAIREAVRDPSAEKVDRSPLTAWEQYAQALLMTNEMTYVN